MRLPPAFAGMALLLCGAALAAPDADLAAAHKLAREGRSAEAVRAAKAAAQAAPDDAAPGRLVQDILREEGLYEELASYVPQGATPLVTELLAARRLAPEKAEPVLTALLEMEGAPPQTHVDLASTYIELKKPRSAEAAAKAYIDLRPQDAEGHYVVGRARFDSGSARAAQEPAQKATALAPGWAPAAIFYSHVLVELGRDDEARAALTDALKLFPRSPALVRGLATDQIRGGELKEAGATLGRLIKLREARSGPRVLLADVQARLGNLDVAEKTARAALDLDEKNAGAHRILGLVLEKKDDFEGALVAYERAEELRPGWAQVHLDLGVVFTLLDEYESAEESLERALELDEKMLEARFRLAQVHYFANDSKAAKKSLATVLKEDKDHVPANRLLGRILLADGKAKTAIKHFEKAAQADPDDSDSMRMIGKCWVALGKPDKAIDAMVEALARDPNDPWAHLDLGKVLETDDAEGAEESYRKAVELGPKNPHVHYYLARLLDEVIGPPEEALEHYQLYIDLGGDDEDGEVAARIEQLSK